MHTPLQAAVAAVEDEEDPIAVIQLLPEKGTILDVWSYAALQCGGQEL